MPRNNPCFSLLTRFRTKMSPLHFSVRRNAASECSSWLMQDQPKQGYFAIQFLANERIPVRINAQYAILHHKFAVFDERDVWTGSENFTSSAKKRNAGNALLLRNQPQLAKQYGLEWRRLWYEGSDVTPKY